MTDYIKLNIEDGVITNPAIDNVLANLDNFLVNSDKWSDFPIWISSGVRTPQSQLALIKSYAIKKGLELPDLLTMDNFIPVWSKLLNVGIIINPPIDSHCIYDYWKLVNGVKVNHKGYLIPTSPHIKGTAFNVPVKMIIIKH